MLRRLRVTGWNIESGGFSSYNPQLLMPVREAKINGVIQAQNADFVSLIDAYRWRRYYGSDEDIAWRWGFESAKFMDLGDDRFKDHPGMGLVVMTNEPVARFTELSMGARCALGTVLDIGPDGLQIITFYLDDESEEKRFGQISELLSQIAKGVPTLLVCDANSLRLNLSGASLRHKSGDLAIRLASAVFRRSSAYLARSVCGMNERRVVPRILEAGFTDGDPKCRPTAPASFPCLGVDYAFGRDIGIEDFCVVNSPEARAASDHLPIVFSVAV